MSRAIDPETARRLRWRCRRGLLEVDLILEGFAARDLPLLDAADAVRLGALLEHPDPILLEWLLGRDPPPPELASMVRRVRGTDAP